MLTNKFANTALCQHARLNNQPCGQPAIRGQKFCRFHESSHRTQPDYSIPMVEDALSLQFAIMQVIRALHDRAMFSHSLCPADRQRQSQALGCRAAVARCCGPGA